MRSARLLTVAATALLAACAAGPDYHKPALDLPAAWKVEAPWRAAAPDDAAAKGTWWKTFGDAQLDKLEQQALGASPTLAVAAARLAQARSTLEAVGASRYPQLGINARTARQRISANRPLTNYSVSNFSTTQNDYTGSLSVSYEPDLSGRVRRAVEGARASAEQSASDLENTRLLLTADLASAYFNLRELDIELDVVSRSIGLQRRALELARARHDLGAASGLDVAQQQALLDSTLTQVDVLRKQRAQFEHAIAALAGAAAPAFAIAPQVKPLTPPAIPLGVPSDVLQRRPDVASAERAMAAANARIGIASAAFYPSIALGANYGGESRVLPALFDAPGAVWAFGLSLTQPLFDGGRLEASLAGARAGYDAAVASYRKVVLTAMQEVEDGITGLAALERAHDQARQAIASTSRVLDLATSRYEGGVATYLDVISAQQALLSSERQAAQLQGQRLLTSVYLIKALGGDWPRKPTVMAQ